MEIRRPRWNEPPAVVPERAPVAELVVAVFLVGWNVAANLVVPGPAEVPAAILGAIVLLLIARWGGSAWGELGFSRDARRRGVRVGFAAAGVITIGVVLVGLVPQTREVLADDRFVGVGAGEMLYDTLLRIPIGTALSEEIAFRGVVLGMLLRWTTPLQAVLASSALFGLWHILPAIDALRTTAVADDSPAVQAGAVAGQVLVTFLAGVAFSWLRMRARHLAAPVIAHWALNATAYAAGWLVVRHEWA